MVRPLPADETLALRRIRVALRQRDPRKLAIAVEHLADDLDNGARYLRLAEWNALAESAKLELELSPGLQARVAEVLARLLGRPRPLLPEPSPRNGGAAILAVVAAWDGAMASDQARAGCLRVLDRSASSSVGQLRGWLGAGASVEMVASRANALLSAAHLGALDRPPPWMDALVAGLQAASGSPDEEKCGFRGLSPSLGPADVKLLVDFLCDRSGGGILTAHVGIDWEDAFGRALRRLSFDPSDVHLVKLAGSLDWFYCFRCLDLAEAAGMPLAIACPRCGGPCWPLVAPPGNPYFSPAPLRDVWGVGERVLAQADTWILVDPPSPRAADAVVRWLMRRWTPEKKVFVVARQAQSQDAWRSALERQGARRIGQGDRVEAVLEEILGAPVGKEA